MVPTFKELFAHKGGPRVSSADADASFQRGNIHASQQQWQPALDCFREAVRLDANHAAAHAHMGNVLRQLRDPAAAMAAYDRAIAIKADYPEVHFNRGALLHQARQTSAALECYDKALSINSSFTEAHCSRGDALRELGRLEEALASYNKAIATNRGYFKAHFNLGTLHRDAGNITAALISFDAAIAAGAAHAGAHAERGNALMALGRLEAAVASFDMAIGLNPDSARVLSNRAQAQAKLGLLDAARASHDQAIMLGSQDAAIHFNRGVFLSDHKEWKGAIENYQAAIRLQPDHADALCNLGLAQQETGQEDAALESYSRALAINPRLATALNNRGNLFRSRKQFAKALLDYRQALALDPAFADAHYNLGQLALLQGDLAAGWPEYEWRRLIKEALTLRTRELPQPAWFGEHALGKRIFLHAEQGIGDTIQFCRYVSMVAGLGAEVALEVQRPLRELLAGLDGVSQLISAGEAIPSTDFQCSLMSLPGAFQTTLETIPCPVAYLRSDPRKVARWREVLGPRKRPRIGLAWSGNARHSNDHNRSVTLAQWVKHLPDEFDFFCLQSEIRDADRDTLHSGAKIRTFDSHLDFAETAALIETLDLVISVDTSLAHLSGAMGKETWILLAFLPDWRWLLDRKDSPWYPTATLYRQPMAGDWDSVMADVKADLLLRFP
jgi:tetratricopeptide (TPR) repeat protein